MNINSEIQKDINNALQPYIRTGKKIGTFALKIFDKTLDKSLPIMVNICTLPLHGLNYAIFKARKKNNGSKYNYKGSKITKASNWLGNKLAKITENMVHDRMR